MTTSAHIAEQQPPKSGYYPEERGCIAKMNYIFRFDAKKVIAFTTKLTQLGVESSTTIQKNVLGKEFYNVYIEMHDFDTPEAIAKCRQITELYRELQ